MKHLKVKKEGHLCWVCLNRPKSLNALNTEILKELTEFNASLKAVSYTHLTLPTKRIV